MDIASVFSIFPSKALAVGLILKGGQVEAVGYRKTNSHKLRMGDTELI